MKLLQEYLIKSNLDAAVFKSIGEAGSPTIRYLTGFAGPGILFIPKRGVSRLIVDALEVTTAKTHYKNVIEAKEPIQELKKLLPRWRRPKLAVELKTWTVPEYFKIKAKYVDISEYLQGRRIKKSRQELKQLHHAAHQTSLIFNKLVKNWNFKTESDVAAWIDYEIKKRGGTNAFPTIVASGKNAARPHYEPKATRLRRGFCVIDFGMKYKGYCADMTRTVFIGRPTGKDLENYDAVFKAHQAAVNLAKPGVKFKDLDSAAMDALGNKAKYFIHSLGHGIGLEVHEPPKVGQSSKDILEPGMCFTIEPGIYYPNKLGIRLEDDLVVTRTGVRYLTSSPRKLITIR